MYTLPIEIFYPKREGVFTQLPFRKSSEAQKKSEKKVFAFRWKEKATNLRNR